MLYTLHYPPQSPLALGVAALKELGGKKRPVYGTLPLARGGLGWGSARSTGWNLLFMTNSA